MKHFIVEVIYRVPAEALDDVTPLHREFLRAGYEGGMLLFSGPQVPRVGGIIVARAESVELIEGFFARDPYRLQGLADYRFIEFNPLHTQDFMKPWVAGS